MAISALENRGPQETGAPQTQKSAASHRRGGIHRFREERRRRLKIIKKFLPPPDFP
jgi:hypothetical protein